MKEVFSMIFTFGICICAILSIGVTFVLICYTLCGMYEIKKQINRWKKNKEKLKHD